jgi:DNA replication protein DnaC
MRLLNKYLKPDLLIIDDMGLKILPQKSGEILLEIIMRRYENRSTMMTSNRPIEEWGKLLSDVPAIAPRLLQSTRKRQRNVERMEKPIVLKSFSTF